MMKKIITISVIIAFLFNSTLGYGYSKPTLFKEKSHAQRYIKDEKPPFIDILETPHLADITQKYGRVVDSYKGKENNKVIIHIQDCHINETAQLNIASIIGELSQKYNIYLLSLEGASKELDTSFYDAFPDGAIKEKVAKFFIKKGLFTGSEYYKITHKDQYLKATGSEDKKLYFEHLKSYKENQPSKEKILSLLKAIKQSLNAIKDKLYSKDLKELDDKSNKYKDKTIQLADYVQFLAGHKVCRGDIYGAQKKGFDTLSGTGKSTPYPNVSAFLALIQKEKQIDFAKAQKQREDLIKHLSRTLEQEKIRELLEKSLEFKLAKITEKEFYIYLKELIETKCRGDIYGAQEKGLDKSSPYSMLFAYIDYIEYSTKIDYLALFNEVDDLENKIMRALCKNDTQLELSRYSKAVFILEELYNLKLTKEKLQYINENPKDFDIKNIQGFLRHTSQQYGLDINAQVLSISLSKESFDNSIKFYEIALKRDIALVENTLKNMQSQRKDKAILITGGFHTSGITNVLKQKGISYVVICPTIGEQDCEKIYKDRVEGRLFDIAILVGEFFSQTLSPPIVSGDAAPPSLVLRTKDIFRVLHTIAEARGEFKIGDQSLPPALDKDIVIKAHQVNLNNLPVGTLVHYEIEGGRWVYTFRIEENGYISIWLRGDRGRIIAPISKIGNFVNLVKNMPSGVLEEGKEAYMPYFHQSPFGEGERRLEYIGLEGFNAAPENIVVQLPAGIEITGLREDTLLIISAEKLAKKERLEKDTLLIISAEKLAKKERLEKEDDFRVYLHLLIRELAGKKRNRVIEFITNRIQSTGKEIDLTESDIEDIISKVLRTEHTISNLDKNFRLIDGFIKPLLISSRPSPTNLGALKDIGDEDAEEVPQEIIEKWQDKARAVEEITMEIKGLKIKAKFITHDANANAPMPPHMSAYHFYDGDTLVIITRLGVYDPIEEEALYHEAKEAYWIRVLIEKLPKGNPLSEIKRMAHRLAAAEEVLAFGRDGITPYHQQQLEDMSYEKLSRLLQENREEHHKLVREYLGLEAEKTVVKYETILQDRAAKKAEPSPISSELRREHTLATSSNPVYMAYCLFLDRILGLHSQIQGFESPEERIKLFSLSYGVSEAEVREGLEKLNSQGQNFVLNKIVKMIRENLNDPRAANPEFFMQNILLPYLGFLSREDLFEDPSMHKFIGEVEEGIFLGFQKAFDIKTGNPLREFVAAFRRQLGGEPRNLGYLIALNKALRPYNFRLFVDPDQCIGYRIVFSVEVNSEGVGSVLILKRTGISLLGTDKGLSIKGDPNVTITSEYIDLETQVVDLIVDQGLMPMGYSKTAEKMWRDAGLDSLTASEADEIVRSLYVKDFAGLSPAQRREKIIHGLAVHETKHKWDENNSDLLRDFIDAEVSAYLTESIYGKAPFVGLFSLIRSLERFYYRFVYNAPPQAEVAPGTSAVVKETLSAMIKQAWVLAGKVAKGEINEEQLRSSLLEIYQQQYWTIEGHRHLPDLQRFERNVLAPLGQMALYDIAGIPHRTALKDIGDEDAEEVPDEIKAKWREKAKTAAEETRTIKGLIIKAKFITDDTSAPMPQGMSAWHFYDGDTLVIVTRQGLDKAIEGEAIYHEAREAYWIYKVGLDSRSAHRLAAAEEVLAFGRDGLTPYHEQQLNNMSDEKLGRLIEEDREAHHKLIEQYLPDGLQAIIKYETILQDRAAKLRQGIATHISPELFFDIRHASSGIVELVRDYLRRVLAGEVSSPVLYSKKDSDWAKVGIEIENRARLKQFISLMEHLYTEAATTLARENRGLDLNSQIVRMLSLLEIGYEGRTAVDVETSNVEHNVTALLTSPAVVDYLASKQGGKKIFCKLYLNGRQIVAVEFDNSDGEREGTYSGKENVIYIKGRYMYGGKEAMQRTLQYNLYKGDCWCAEVVFSVEKSKPCPITAIRFGSKFGIGGEYRRSLTSCMGELVESIFAYNKKIAETSATAAIKPIVGILNPATMAQLYEVYANDASSPTGGFQELIELEECMRQTAKIMQEEDMVFQDIEYLFFKGKLVNTYPMETAARFATPVVEVMGKLAKAGVVDVNEIERLLFDLPQEHYSAGRSGVERAASARIARGIMGEMLDAGVPIQRIEDFLFVHMPAKFRSVEFLFDYFAHEVEKLMRDELRTQGLSITGVNKTAPGALKDIGDEDVEEVPKEIMKLWQEKASRAAEGTRTIKGLTIKAKFITDDTSAPMPQGMSAWHFYDGDTLVIVTRQGLDKAIEAEAIYHEARESYWIKDKGLDNRTAHRLAAAEEVVAFSKNGSILTPYHNLQLDNMPVSQLRKLLEEDRERQHKLIEEHLGVETRQLVEKYEEMFRNKVKEIAVTGAERLCKLLRDFVEAKDIPEIAAIADVHGNLLRLIEILKWVPDEIDEIVFLGDYMDRGPDGIKVMKKIMDLSKTRRIIPLMGNHDLLFITAMMGDFTAFKLWIGNGGIEVLKECGFDKKFPEIIKGLESAMNNAIVRRRHPLDGVFEYAGKETDKVGELYKMARENVELNEVAMWMKENLKVYYIGKNGALYIHTAMPMDEDGNIVLKYGGFEGIEALAKLEEDMQNAFRENNIEAAALQFLNYAKHSSPLWARKAVNPKKAAPLNKRHNDIKVFEETDTSLLRVMERAGAGKILDQLGVASLIVGHTPVDKVVNIQGCIFAIDRSIVSGEGAAIRNGKNGIQYESMGGEQVLLEGTHFDIRVAEGKRRAKKLLNRLMPKETIDLIMQEAIRDYASQHISLNDSEREILKAFIEDLRGGFRGAFKEKLIFAVISILATGESEDVFDRVAEIVKSEASLSEQGYSLTPEMVMLYKNLRREDKERFNKIRIQILGRMPVWENGKILDYFVQQAISELAYMVDEELDERLRTGKPRLFEISLDGVAEAIQNNRFAEARNILIQLGTTERLNHVFVSLLTERIGRLQLNPADPTLREEILSMVKPSPQALFSPVPMRRTISIGGKREGGLEVITFTGEIWIEAGSFAYKVWVEGEEVKFQRHESKYGPAAGSVRSFALGKKYCVGRKIGNYTLKDSLLSSSHFSLTITKNTLGQDILELEDLKSLNGIKAEYIMPIAGNLGAQFGGDLDLLRVLLKYAWAFYAAKEGRDAADRVTPQEHVSRFLEHLRSPQGELSPLEREALKGAGVEELNPEEHEQALRQLDSLELERPKWEVKVLLLGLPKDRVAEIFKNRIKAGQKEGIGAINYYNPFDGVWYVIMLKEDYQSHRDTKGIPTLRHELREIALRQSGVSWTVAHNMVVDELGIGGKIDPRIAAAYDSGLPDAIGVKFGTTTETYSPVLPPTAITADKLDKNNIGGYLPNFAEGAEPFSRKPPPGSKAELHTYDMLKRGLATDDSVPSLDQIFALGRLYKIIAHGVKPDYGGLKNLLLIMLNGKIKPSPAVAGTTPVTYTGVLDDTGGPGGNIGSTQTTSGQYGPFYVVLYDSVEKGGTFPEGIGEEYHMCYLVPDDKTRDIIIDGIDEALSGGIITEERAAALKKKIKTYQEFKSDIDDIGISVLGRFDYRRAERTQDVNEFVEYCTTCLENANEANAQDVISEILGAILSRVIRTYMMDNLDGVFNIHKLSQEEWKEFVTLSTLCENVVNKIKEYKLNETDTGLLFANYGVILKNYKAVLALEQVRRNLLLREMPAEEIPPGFFYNILPQINIEVITEGLIQNSHLTYEEFAMALTERIIQNRERLKAGELLFTSLAPEQRQDIISSLAARVGENLVSKLLSDINIPHVRTVVRESERSAAKVENADMGALVAVAWFHDLSKELVKDNRYLDTEKLEKIGLTPKDIKEIAEMVGLNKEGDKYLFDSIQMLLTHHVISAMIFRKYFERAMPKQMAETKAFVDFVSRVEGIILSHVGPMGIKEEIEIDPKTGKECKFKFMEDLARENPDKIPHMGKTKAEWGNLSQGEKLALLPLAFPKPKDINERLFLDIDMLALMRFKINVHKVVGFRQKVLGETLKEALLTSPYSFYKSMIDVQGLIEGRVNGVEPIDEMIKVARIYRQRTDAFIKWVMPQVESGEIKDAKDLDSTYDEFVALGLEQGATEAGPAIKTSAAGTADVTATVETLSQADLYRAIFSENNLCIIPRRFGFIIDTTTILTEFDEEIIRTFAALVSKSKESKFVIVVLNEEGRQKLVSLGFPPKSIQLLDDYLGYLKQRGFDVPERFVEQAEKIKIAACGMRREIGLGQNHPVIVVAGADIDAELVASKIEDERNRQKGRVREEEQLNGVFVVSQEIPDTDIVIKGEKILRENARLLSVIFAEALRLVNNYMSNPDTIYAILSMLPPITSPEFINRIDEIKTALEEIASQA